MNLINRKNLGQTSKFKKINLNFNVKRGFFNIESLKASPPDNCSYELLEVYENEASICLIYLFIKEDKKNLMSQTFLMEGDLIKRIRLIFNVQELMNSN